MGSGAEVEESVVADAPSGAAAPPVEQGADRAEYTRDEIEKHHHAWMRQQHAKPGTRGSELEPHGRVYRVTKVRELCKASQVLSYDTFHCLGCNSTPCKNPYICCVCDALDIPCCLNAINTWKKDVCTTCHRYVYCAKVNRTPVYTHDASDNYYG